MTWGKILQNKFLIRIDSTIFGVVAIKKGHPQQRSPTLHIYIVTRKYDTLIYLPSCGGRRSAADFGSKQESADDSGKQELQNSGSGRDHFSSTPLYHYKLIWA